MLHRDQFKYKPRTKPKKLIDLLTAPIRLLLNESWIKKLGLTTLTEQRMEAVLPHIKGDYLDVGCGYNWFTKAYGSGWGTDISSFPGVNFVSNAELLPVQKERFDTVTLIANLNHIINKDRALKEAFSILKPGGKIILTMLTPFIGTVTHFLIRWWDWDRGERGHIHAGDQDGISNKTMKQLLESAGFRDIFHKRFQYGLNHLWIGYKAKSRPLKN